MCAHLDVATSLVYSSPLLCITVNLAIAICMTVGVRKIFQFGNRVGLNGLGTLGPVRGADLSVQILLGKVGVWNRINSRRITRTVNWKASISLMVSSTDLPTGRSLTVICLPKAEAVIVWPL